MNAICLRRDKKQKLIVNEQFETTFLPEQN